MHGTHLVNHITHPELYSDNTLYVIGVCSNPVRYHSRYRLAREWLAAMEATPNVQLCVVEAAFGDRHHEITECHNKWHLQLRTSSEIWIKENMINLAVARLLPRTWRYVAWVDMDVFFDNRNWAQETIHQLQHFPIVQPWSECVDRGPYGEVMKTFTSFCKLDKRGVKKQKRKEEPYQYGHCGYAWACTRAFFESVRGLIDVAILGSADYMMAWACIGESHGTSWGMGKGFEPILKAWEERAMRMTHGNVGYVNGLISHSFHGSKNKRYYQSRNEILVKHAFDPLNDIHYDSQGVIRILGKPALEMDVHKYNLSRKEDGTEE